MEVRDDCYPEVLGDLASLLAAVFVRPGVEADLAAQLARDAVECIRSEYGGDRLYMPRGRSFDANQTHREMYQRWKAGTPPKDLAKTYGMSPRWVRQVLANCRRKDAGRGRL